MNISKGKKGSGWFHGGNGSWISFGLVLAGLLIVATPLGWAGTFTNLQVLWSFPVSNATAYPQAGLMEGSDGMLYGTTYGGSTNSDFGSVFRIGKDGNNFSLLHKLVEGEGDAPSGVLIEATNGVLYGTAFDEGAFAYGSIFKINRNGTGFAVIHNFTTNVNDGTFPGAGLLQASDGRLYGTTQQNGADGQGTVFRVDLNGSNFMVLHQFIGGPTDGAYPAASLIEGTNGMLYGTTTLGGDSVVGTVFKLNKDGSDFSLIHNFTGGTGDGSNPNANLFKGTNGMLYGTATFEGQSGYGVVFSIDYNGNVYSVLHHFGSIAGDGQTPQATLTQGPDGALYGTTVSGGALGNGTVFRIDYDGNNYGVVVSFIATNGANLRGMLLAGSDGALYGTCNAGGPLSRGSVFKLTDTAYDYNVLAAPEKLSGSGWRVRGHGVPSRIYSVQYATNLAAPTIWAPLGKANANTQGDWQLDDPANSTRRFYRTAYP